MSAELAIRDLSGGYGRLAIFRGLDIWSKYDAVLIVWGDQVFVSTDTLTRAITALGMPQKHIVLPVTRMAAPYVEYVFDGSRLTKVLQTREGDTFARFDAEAVLLFDPASGRRIVPQSA